MAQPKDQPDATTQQQQPTPKEAQPHQPGTPPTAKEANPAQVIDPAKIPKDEQPKPAKYRSPCGDTDDDRQADLCEQQRMSSAAESAANYAFLQLIFGIIGLAFVVAGLLFAGIAAFAARDAAKTAEAALTISRETSENQIRPYVYVSNAQFIWDQLGARAIIECSNSGQTPATYFEIGAMSRAMWRGPADEIEIPEDLSYRRWSALGGGAVKTIGLRGAVTDDGADPFGEDARKVLDARGEMNFFVLGRVKYGDIFRNEYETEFVFFTPDTTPKPNSPEGVKMLSPPGNFAAFRITKKGHQE